MSGREASGFEGFAARRRLSRIRSVILVGSGKGGVGKSLVACGVALKLAGAGRRTGLLDADLHGASVPGYLGVGPPLSSGSGGLVPKESGRVRVMSVALMTGDSPVPVRGQAKEGLLTELFSLTDWGDLDFLVVDLPPSTGDELLTAFSLFGKKCGLVLVTTPSPGSLSVVTRLSRLAASEGVRVAGVVVNMAFFREGGRVSHPFGTVDVKSVEGRLGSKVIAQVPLEPGVSGEGLRGVLAQEGKFSSAFDRIAERLVRL
jgi:ATP-binding protein involved in chromosome partitioning